MVSTMSSVNKGRRKYLKYVGAATTATVSALAGCTGGEGDSNDGNGNGTETPTEAPGTPSPTSTGTRITKEEPPELTAAPSPGTANVIFQVIKDEGIDEDNGVNINVELMDPNSSAQAVVNRQVPTGFLSSLATARANFQGNNIRQLWPMFTNNESCVVSTDANVSTGSLGATLEDLQDLTIGALPETSTLYNIFHLLLIQHDLDIDDFDIRTGPPPVMAGLTEDGELDGMIMIAPLPSKFVASGNFERVLNYDTAWREVTGYSVSQIEAAAHQDVIDQNRPAFRGYFEAYHEAQARVSENPDEYLSRYADDIGVSESEIPVLVEYAEEIDWFKSEYSESLRQGDIELVELAYQEGLLEQRPDIDAMFIDPREL